MAEINLDKLLEHFDKRFDQLIENVKEVRLDINSVRQDFNTFEAGRMTDLTSKVAVLEERQNKDEDNPIKTMVFEVLKAVVLAVVMGVMFLLIKNQI